MDDIYKMISSPAEGLYKEKGSKFISLAYPVTSEEQVKEILLEAKKKYYDARHHCYAWVIGTEQPLFRSNDDGEPSGSAGKPILNQIYSFGLTNTLIIVVRYFGGIKLGVSGLVHAYKTAAKEALANAEIEEKTINVGFALHFQYPIMNDVMRVMKEENLPLQKTIFELDCLIESFCRKSEINRVVEKLEKIYGLKIQTTESL